MIFFRLCPKCNEKINYKTKSQKNWADKKNSTCILCRNKTISYNRKCKDILEKKCNICGKITNFSKISKYKNSKNNEEYLCKICALKKAHSGKILSNSTKNKISISKIGKPRPEYVKKNLSKIMSGKNNPMYGRTGNRAPMYGRSGVLSPTYAISPINKGKKLQNDDTRKKMRLSAINRMNLNENGKLQPSYNLNACKIIEEYGKKNGYNFQHAMNGGEFYIKELGYWVDGYDKDKNVVLEVDEKYHFNKNGILRDRDIRRQKEIIEFLKCKFIRLKL